MTLVKTPGALYPIAAGKLSENVFFNKLLSGLPLEKLSPLVQQLNETVSAAIDCTACGNCCKKLEPGLEQDEVEVLAAHRQMEPEVFMRRYVSWDGDSHFLQAKPCMFLEGTVCSIYEHRPGSCAGYPHLDQPAAIRNRHIWESYSMCPIVFNVVEELKAALNFTPGSIHSDTL